MKLIDKIVEFQNDNKVFYSFEFFPPKTENGVSMLFSRMEDMSTLTPLFSSVTWNSNGVNCNQNTLDLVVNAKKYYGMEMMLHVSCSNMTVKQVRDLIQDARKGDIGNILAIRGDAKRGMDAFECCEDGMEHASELVELIKDEAEEVGLAVAGYPERHLESDSWEMEMAYLKRKIEKGADFVITQMFYDVDMFLEYVQKCRSYGIQVPIIPGIMPIQSYRAFRKMAKACKTNIPMQILNDLESIKDDDLAVKDYGIKLAIDMCKKLVENGVCGFHFYTLNLERSVRKILQGLSLHGNRDLPWRASAQSNRASESVRPIFWANRPKSYLGRTSRWDADEFSNGRWGSNASPAFGELSDSHYTPFDQITVQDRKVMWGDCLVSLDDVSVVFAKYIRGEIPQLPWCDMPLHLETSSIQEQLLAMIEKGYFTINSQPCVNGLPSEDPKFGWGGKHGKVYQKAYIECFLSPQQLKHIIQQCQTSSTIDYLAVDVSGNSYSNRNKGTTAVTWGVFPNREILQPTVVDTDSFFAWKDEAFSLWLSMWANIYPEGSTSESLLHEIHDNYFLVSIVENDFIHGNIWRLFTSS